MVYSVIPLLLGAHAMVEIVNTRLSLENARIKIKKKLSNHLKMFRKRES